MDQSDGFEEVFASYLAALPGIGRRADALVRAPHVFGRVWNILECVPDPARTVLVTGSKGKGTVARLTSWNLQSAGLRVGLVVTPEELSHLDRIRIDNQPISKTNFDRLLRASLPLLRTELSLTAPGRYLSPTGIFLTVALLWFREQSVDWCVIEGGRGVQADEIGQIKARLGVVTTVLDEHLVALGGTTEMVLRDKLSIASIAATTVVGPQVAAAAGLRDYTGGLIVAGVEGTRSTSSREYPSWYRDLCAIAREAYKAIQPSKEFALFATPSFWRSRIQGIPILCEAIVAGQSIDIEFLQAVLPERTEVLLGLSDDKDINGILNQLRRAGIHRFSALILKSSAMHVSSNWIHSNSYLVECAGEIDVVQPDLNLLRSVIERIAGRSAAVYVAGVQVFMRSVRRALRVELMEGRQ